MDANNSYKEMYKITNQANGGRLSFLMISQCIVLPI